MKKRLIALILIGMMLFSACGEKTPDTPTPDEENMDNRISMPWDSSKGFDMIEMADDDNYALSRLVFDSLFELDATYKPVPVLAEAVQFSGNDCTVTLKQGISFHDGQTLTATDVEYTVRMHLKNEKSPYYTKLSQIKDMRVDSRYSITFMLESKNGMFVHNLDFPIIKNGASEYTTVGTGRYVYTKRGASEYLEKNKSYYDAANTTVERIYLIAGRDDYFVDYFNDGSVTLISQKENLFNTKITAYSPAGTFVSSKLNYLALNIEKPALDSAQMRGIISYAISRTGILNNFSATKAYTTYSLINPTSYLYNAAAVGSATRVSAKDELEKLGYIADENGVYVTLTVLVNSADYEEHIIARGMAESLEPLGIAVNISSLGGTDYEKAVKNKRYDMRFDSARIPTDLDLTDLLREHGMLTDTLLSLIGTLRAATTDEDRKSAAFSLLKELDRYTPVIPLYFTTVEYISNDAERGELAPTPTCPLGKIWQMSKKS